jgi:hypothetical protein
MGARIAAVLRLPLSAIVIASILCASAGSGVASLVIVGVVASYLMTLALEGKLGQANDTSGSSQGRSTAGPAGATGD